MTKVPMTVRGAELLRAELKKLKSEDRPRVIQSIAEARAHGDLKENAEYHAAKDQQGFIEARIKELEAKLSNTQIIDVTTIDAKGKVVFGSTVVLLDVNLEVDPRRAVERGRCGGWFLGLSGRSPSHGFGMDHSDHWRYPARASRPSFEVGPKGGRRVVWRIRAFPATHRAA